jgi:DNA-binding YbaB/EbfC family protein
MMRNMAGMMKKVQEMQDRLQSLQSELAEMHFTAEVANGAVRATVTGDGRVASLKLDPAIISADDAEMLEDLICLATNNAHQDGAETKAKLMKDITGGLPLPPDLSLPF